MPKNNQRMCSYVVRNDLGLAPNPFWGYCTLAVCTPNHMGIRPQKEDWFIGTESVTRGSKLIYTMQVSKVLPFEVYYGDPTFDSKKPNIHGTWPQQCGDNMYYKDHTGEWRQHRTIYHREPEIIKQDLKHPYVFIAEYFYYFGENAITIPFEYQGLIQRRQGCKCNHNSDTIQNFLSWLQSNFEPGIHGQPRDKLRSISSSIELKL